jgi:hypothetical protein
VKTILIFNILILLTKGIGRLNYSFIERLIFRNNKYYSFYQKLGFENYETKNFGFEFHFFIKKLIFSKDI